MRTILKTSLAMIIILLGLLSVVNADEETMSNSNTQNGNIESSTGSTSSQEENTSSESTSDEKENVYSGSINKETKNNYKKTIRENIQIFRAQSGSLRDNLTLSQEDKAKVEELRTQHETDVETLKEEYKAKIDTASTSSEKDTLRVELRNNLQELNKTFLQELNSLVSQNDEAKAYIEARKAVFEKNQEIRKEHLKAREEARGERKTHILKYKENFTKKLGKTIDRIANKDIKKLDVVISKIDAMMSKYELNKKISTENKNKILDQLKALKELVEDSVDQVEIENDDE